MKLVLRNERGMALALAIFALVIIGALVAGAFTGMPPTAFTNGTRVAAESETVISQPLPTAPPVQVALTGFVVMAAGIHTSSFRVVSVAPA